MTPTLTDATLTDEELAALEKLCAEATPGPWVFDAEHDNLATVENLTAECVAGSIMAPESRGGRYIARVWDDGPHPAADGLLLAKARAALPQLLREVRRARAALSLTEQGGEEDTARLINGLVEAGDLLFQHVQRIDWDPAASTLARECWLESRATLSGDHGQKCWPEDAPESLRPVSMRDRALRDLGAGGGR